MKEQNELEISKTGELASIEADKFKQMVDSIGANTIQAIATSGPEMQVCSIREMHVCLKVELNKYPFYNRIEMSR